MAGGTGSVGVVTTRDAWILRAFALWTAYVWGTRLWNLWTDPAHPLGFKVVHSVLAAVSVAFAVAAWRIVRRSRASARRDPALVGER